MRHSRSFAPNVILVLIDSLNRNELRPYDSTAVADVPNFERFAGRARRFDNHFVNSLPCMPARREIYSGRMEMMWRPWGPLEAFDQRLPRLLAGRGYSTGIVTDHYHYWEEEANGYIQSFDSAELIRGHELDFWRTPLPVTAPIPEWVRLVEQYRPGFGRAYYANVSSFESEEDYFPAKVMKAASTWLDGHTGEEPFFLQVESFDVHEPFDVPEPYRSMYDAHGDRNSFNIWPPYQDTEELARFMSRTSKEELEFIRSQYRGKLSMVDRWFGKLLDTLDEKRLWEDTVVIVTTDHGHDLGERGAFGKQWPHFDSHANIPLFIWHPDNAGNSQPVDSLTGTVDLYATILDAAGAEVPSTPGHSRSLLPLLDGNAAGARDTLIYGTFGQGVGITDGAWTLLKSPQRDGPLYSYSSSVFRSLTTEHVRKPVDQGYLIPGVELPQWKIPMQVAPLSTQDHLYHRAQDPGMTTNLWHEDPQQRERLQLELRKNLERTGTPPEQFERLGL